MVVVALMVVAAAVVAVKTNGKVQTRMITPQQAVVTFAAMLVTYGQLASSLGKVVVKWPEALSGMLGKDSPGAFAALDPDLFQLDSTPWLRDSLVLMIFAEFT